LLPKGAESKKELPILIQRKSKGKSKGKSKEKSRDRDEFGNDGPDLHDHDWGVSLKDRAMEMRNSIPEDIRGIVISSKIDHPAIQDANYYQYLYLKSAVYVATHNFCVQFIPLPYIHICRDVLKKFDNITAGLHWGDSPQMICLRENLCTKTSYLGPEHELDEDGLA